MLMLRCLSLNIRYSIFLIVFFSIKKWCLDFSLNRTTLGLFVFHKNIFDQNCLQLDPKYTG